MKRLVYASRCLVSRRLEAAHYTTSRDFFHPAMPHSVEKNEQHHPKQEPKPKRKLRALEMTRMSLIIAGIGAALVLFLLLAAYAFLRGVSFNLPAMVVENVSNIFGQQLQTDSNGDTNVLVIGVGGEKHEGPYLTDSIMLVNIKNNQSSVGMLSIPRDLYVSVPGVGGTKINGVYTLAMQKAGAQGILDENSNAEVLPEVHMEAMNTLKDVVERVTGSEIQYTVRIDFKGFVDLVDMVGGVEVDVPENFIDRQYPDNNYGYETFFLRAGHQLLDGETALKYARSRHSSSDFDRAKRQQTILKALLDKLISKDILTNPSQLRRIYLSLSSNITTDLSWREILRLAGYAQKLPRENIASAVLSDDPTLPGGVLYNPDRAAFGGAAVLLPKGATAANPNYYKDIQFFTYMFFHNPQFFANPPKVLVLNGTLTNGRRVSGIASLASTLFGKYGIEVESGNAPAGVGLPETTFFFYSKEDADKNADNFQLFIPGQREIFDPHSTAQNPNDPEGALAALLSEHQGEYTAVLVVGNDYAQYLK